jgi:hypothetical protein
MPVRGSKRRYDMAMSLHPDRRPRKCRRHPRVFLEQHPTLLPSLCMLAGLGVVIYFAAHRLLH